MNSQPSLASVLLAIFDLTRLGHRPDAIAVAGRLGISGARVERALMELARRGLLDAERVRPTLAGLAACSALELERSARELGFEREPSLDDAANDAPRRTSRAA